MTTNQMNEPTKPKPKQGKIRRTSDGTQKRKKNPQKKNTKKTAKINKRKK
jgi:hypothetical protein